MLLLYKIYVHQQLYFWIVFFDLKLKIKDTLHNADVRENSCFQLFPICSTIKPMWKTQLIHWKHSNIDLLSLAVHVRNELRLKRCVENQQNIKIRIFTKKRKKKKSLMEYSRLICQWFNCCAISAAESWKTLETASFSMQDKHYHCFPVSIFSFTF